MKIIRKQKVGLHTIVIKEVDSAELDDCLIEVDEDIDRNNTFGYYKRDDDGTPVIYILKTLEGVEREIVINHELVEAVNEIYDFDLSHMVVSMLAELITEIKGRR